MPVALPTVMAHPLAPDWWCVIAVQKLSQAILSLQPCLKACEGTTAAALTLIVDACGLQWFDEHGRVLARYHILHDPHHRCHVAVGRAG
jgi:hypothetical protein